MVQKHPRGAGVRTAPRFHVGEKADPASPVGAPDRFHLLILSPCPPLAAPRSIPIRRVQSLAWNLRFQDSQQVTRSGLTPEATEDDASQREFDTRARTDPEPRRDESSVLRLGIIPTHELLSRRHGDLSLCTT